MFNTQIDTSNFLCSTDPENSSHFRAPWTFSNTREEVLSKLKKVMTKLNGVKIQAEKENYLQAAIATHDSFDNVEFYLPQEENLLHFRAASQDDTGTGGLNGRRLLKIKTMLAMEGVTFTRG